MAEKEAIKESFQFSETAFKEKKIDFETLIRVQLIFNSLFFAYIFIEFS